MTFEEILDQAVAMLQRRGRLTYRALKLQFNLDDEYLNALKDELIEGQRLAVDENGRVLVWAGGPEATPVSAPQSTPASELPVTEPVQSAQVEPSSSEPPTPDAERRQLTVMFCDLAAAGIPKETVEGKVDWHACRVAYITLLMESDATLKEAQELARHANPQITANVYARVRGGAIHERVERLGETILGENYAHSMHTQLVGGPHRQVYSGDEGVEAAGIEPASGSLQP